MLDITLLKILVFLNGFRRLTGLTYRLSRWTQDGVLQLQRRAYEAQGIRSWENLDDDVPLLHKEWQLEDLRVESMPLTTVVVSYNELKEDGNTVKHEEEIPPGRLASAKTWATQGTLCSVEENSIKTSSSKNLPSGTVPSKGASTE